MRCLSEQELSFLLQGRLTAAEESLANAHIERCPSCRARWSFLASSSEEETQPKQPRPERPLGMLGRYELLECIGRGSMGSVYAAKDRELGRKVAVKVVPASGEGKDAIVQEARHMASLAHPNVIALHDVGSTHDSLYLVMELVEGQTLRSWLSERPRPWRTIISRFVEAGRGLEAAHAQGIVHRDVRARDQHDDHRPAPIGRRQATGGQGGLSSGDHALRPDGGP